MSRSSPRQLNFSMENKRDILVSLDRVSLRYGSREVFSGISIGVARGEVLGVLGRVGSGKTRILRLICGLEEPTEGTVTLRSPVQKGHIGYVFQNDLLIPWLTVGENLLCCARGRMDSLEIGFGARNFFDLKPDHLSGGMKQKVNLARGFLNKDPLVLMDEPFGSLDPVEKQELSTDFLALQQRAGTSVVFVTHDIREAILLCDRIAFLSSRRKGISAVLDNPFRGKLDEHELYASPDYRAFFRQITEIYSHEAEA